MSLTITDALADFVAIHSATPSSPRRLSTLAAFCAQELARNSLVGADTERTIEGLARDKKWDVVWEHDNRIRLAISLKSIIRNVAGTVPNRIDDLMGETANLQLIQPEIVVGYVVLINRDDDNVGTKTEQMRRALATLVAHRETSLSPGTIDAGCLIQLRGNQMVAGDDPDVFFRTLARKVRARNPGVRA